jgi:hypothetical protein
MSTTTQIPGMNVPEPKVVIHITYVRAGSYNSMVVSGLTALLHYWPGWCLGDPDDKSSAGQGPPDFLPSIS